jgi:16S rRNA processing protein RimM
MKVGDSDLFRVGVVIGTHGLRGDLKIRLLSDDSSSLLDARQVVFRKADGEAICLTPARAVLHKGNILLRLCGLESIDAVQSLVGCDVFLRYGDLAKLPDQEFYWFELEGLKVVDRSRGEIGTLEDLFTTPAHDIYVVHGRYGEVLIPAVEEFVVEVDLEGRRMVVDLPEGLIQEPDEV